MVGLRWNLLHNQKHLDKTNVSKRSLSHILRENLRLGVYRYCVSHLFDTRQKTTLWKLQEVAKKVPKNAHDRILFTDEKIFNIEEKFNHQNDHVYAKSCYEAKDKIPRVRIGHHLPSPIGNGLVGSFVLRCNPYSFLRRRRKNKWWGLLSHVEWCLNTSGRNCICEQRWVVLSAEFCACLQSEKKNAKMVARAHSRFHRSLWLALLQPRLQSIGL